MYFYIYLKRKINQFSYYSYAQVFIANCFISSTDYVLIKIKYNQYNF